MHSYWLETARLGLRRFVPEDRAWLQEVYSDPEVTRYLGGVQTADSVDLLFRARFLDYYEQHPGLGIWMTVERGSGDRIGFHLLNNIRGETIIQVGFTLVKSAWNKGYGTEMGEAVVRYGFVTLGLPRIVGMASMKNVASQRVLAKIGLQRRGERAFAHPAYAAEGPMAWFEREAVDWLAERGQSSPAVSL